MTSVRSTLCGRLLAAAVLLASCGESARPAPEPETGGSGGVVEGGGSGGATGGKGGASPTEVPPTRADAEPEPEPADAAPPADSGGSAPSDDGGGGGAGGSPGAAPMVVTPSPACAGTAVMPPPSGMQMIMNNGMQRMFIIHPPNNYDGKKPFAVLFALHGAGTGAVKFNAGDFGTIAKMAADKSWSIFPQAFGGNTWRRDEKDDVAFMGTIVKWLDEKACYDKSQVFAAGQSSGAYFSHRFACDRPDVVRAIATNSGGQRMEWPLLCTVPVSAWTSTGLADDPGHVMATRQANEIWRKLAGCSTDTVPTGVGPCVAYKGCKPGYAVHHCEHPGGHPLPSYGVAGIYGFLFGGKYLGGN
jgi:poly(3-hydroxybutyrate) depolymerase